MFVFEFREREDDEKRESCTVMSCTVSIEGVGRNKASLRGFKECWAGRRLNGARTSKIKVNGVCHFQKIVHYAPGASYTAYPSSPPQTQL